MADEPENTPNNDTPEITLETVTAVEPADLTDEQTKFLQENADTLSDEQKETYKDVLTPKNEEIDLDSLEPETRGGKKAEKKDDVTPAPKDKEDDDDAIDPDDEKTIGKVVKREMEPVQEAIKQLNELKNEREVDSFIRGNSEYAKYRDAALKYMSHPAYSNIPAKNIMAIVAAKDLQALGAKKEREAAAKAKETNSGNGTTTRPQSGGKTDWTNMSKEEFQKQKQAIMQGGRA